VSKSSPFFGGREEEFKRVEKKREQQQQEARDGSERWKREVGRGSWKREESVVFLFLSLPLSPLHVPPSLSPSFPLKVKTPYYHPREPALHRQPAASSSSSSEKHSRASQERS